MADQNPEAGGVMPSSPQPQAGNPSPITPQAGAAADPTPEPEKADKAETFDAEYVKKLREEAAARRTEAAALKAKLAEYDKAKLTELERVALERDEAKAALEAQRAAYREAITLSAVKDAASELGYSTKLAAALSRGHQWEYTDDGQPKGVKDALRQLAKEFPELAASHVTTATTNGQRGVQTPYDPKALRASDPSLWRVPTP